MRKARNMPAVEKVDVHSIYLKKIPIISIYYIHNKPDG
jgi:hypothetical protein